MPRRGEWGGASRSGGGGEGGPTGGQGTSGGLFSGWNGGVGEGAGGGGVTLWGGRKGLEICGVLNALPFYLAGVVMVAGECHALGGGVPQCGVDDAWMKEGEGVHVQAVTGEGGRSRRGGVSRSEGCGGWGGRGWGGFTTAEVLVDICNGCVKLLCPLQGGATLCRGVGTGDAPSAPAEAGVYHVTLLHTK